MPEGFWPDELSVKQILRCLRARRLLRADIDFHLDIIGRLTTENGHLRVLLKEARQYVADAGSYEEPGEQTIAVGSNARVAAQAALLSDIDAALIGQISGIDPDGERRS